MSLGLAISAFIPSIASKGIFAPRRVDKAANANNSIVSAANIGVADAQIVKAGEGVVGIARESKGSLAKRIVAFEEAIKDSAKTSEALRVAGKIGQVAIDNINPLIVGTSIFSVATADEKEREAVEQFFTVGGMFCGEGAYKAITGMAKTERKNGKIVITQVEGLYKKNPFLNKQVAAFKDLCATTKFMNKYMKHAPYVVKGLGFAGASILGSVGGHELVGKPIANAIFGEKTAKNKKTVNVSLTPNIENNNCELNQYYNAA